MRDGSTSAGIRLRVFSNVADLVYVAGLKLDAAKARAPQSE